MFENYDPSGTPLSFWKVDPNNTNVILVTDANGNPIKDPEGNYIPEGHCVILYAYDSVGPTCVSWGSLYKMTWDFFTSYTDAVYSIVSNDWVINTGKTSLGMTTAELEELMSAKEQK